MNGYVVFPDLWKKHSMVGSTLNSTLGAQLTPGTPFCDLDGSLLIDPAYEPVAGGFQWGVNSTDGGRSDLSPGTRGLVLLPEKPGIGVEVKSLLSWGFPGGAKDGVNPHLTVFDFQTPENP